jgi:hypothetical protein
MIYHLSIAADDPRKVANVLAELWGGMATPFPPVIEGSWVALAGDDRNSTIEVYPRGTEIHAGEGDEDAVGRLTGEARRSATHMAISTTLDADAVLAIARREGWPAKYLRRGGVFGVIEMFIEGVQMVEVLTPEMRDEYLAAMTTDNWVGFLQSAGALA